MVLDNILLKKIEEVKQFIANMIPIAGNQTPSADTTNGSSGTNMDYAKSDHTHPKSNLYAETNHTHSQYLTTHQDISGKLNISQTSYKGKNVVVDNTTGNITFEDKPTIPQASTSSPLADMTGGAIGSDSKYAKADHQHPLSSAYATSGHTHTTSDLPSTVMSETDISDIIDTLNTNDIFAYSNKNVGQSGDTICLVGKLYGDDIEGKTIQFYDNNTLLGSSNTDAYGTALYDYVCTGEGEKKITTKYGTSQSEIYGLIDCIKRDGGTSSDHNDIWSTNQTSSSIIVTRTDEYTEFKEAVTGSNFGNSVMGVTDSCVIEFDYYQVDGELNSFMQLYDTNNNQSYTGGINLSSFNGSVGNWYHIKLQIQNGVLTATNTTNGKTFTRTLINTPSKFNFWSSAEITAIRFKNFCIYPI